MGKAKNTAKPGSTRKEEKVETVYFRCLEAGAYSLISLAAAAAVAAVFEYWS
jgi:hypothetical protein